MVDDEYPRPPVPAAELGVEPGVMLAADLSLVEVGLGGVQSDDLRLALGDRDEARTLPQPEDVLEVPVSDVLGVVVAHDHHHVRAS